MPAPQWRRFRFRTPKITRPGETTGGGGLGRRPCRLRASVQGARSSAPHASSRRSTPASSKPSSIAIPAIASACIWCSAVSASAGATESRAGRQAKTAELEFAPLHDRRPRPSREVFDSNERVTSPMRVLSSNGRQAVVSATAGAVLEAKEQGPSDRVLTVCDGQALAEGRERGRKTRTWGPGALHPVRGRWQATRDIGQIRVRAYPQRARPLGLQPGKL